MTVADGEAVPNVAPGETAESVSAPGEMETGMDETSPTAAEPDAAPGVGTGDGTEGIGGLTDESGRRAGRWALACRGRATWSWELGEPTLEPIPKVVPATRTETAAAEAAAEKCRRLANVAVA